MLKLQVEKILSRNDVGATGGHQAGIAIPKNPELLAFFPTLDSAERNPRMPIDFVDLSTGAHFSFNYIYYNGKLSGASTRNEYRLTGMSGYLRKCGAEAGDSVIFTKDSSGYSIEFQPATHSDFENKANQLTDNVIVLSGKWLRKN